MDDILHYDSQYRIVICRPCQCAVVPCEIKSHLQTHHQKEEGLTTHEIANLCHRFLVYPLQPPELVSKIQVSPESPPIPFLRLYNDGFCCKLCPPAKPYVCRTKCGLGQHWKEEHQLSRRRGAPTTAVRLMNDFNARATFPVACQTFFKRSLFVRYFPVKPASVRGSSTTGQGIEARGGVQALSLPEQMELQLSQKLAGLQPAVSSTQGQRHFSQISTWLDATQWTQYLQGHDLIQAAQLIHLPRLIAVQVAARELQEGQGEHHLHLLLDSFDRVIEQARSSLLEDKVNIFDQHRVNSFVPGRDHAWPLLHKLREPTYRSYKKVWKQLLCFLYRLVWQRRTPILHCRLTSAQLTALHAVLQAAAELDVKQKSTNLKNPNPDWYQELDRACLSLCIALLDHSLRGNIYDSIVVGFLAVLGINAKGSYHEAPTYTTHLSAFVKMAQLLVVQRAVDAVEEDEVDYPGDILDVMQDRFMVFGTRSPMNWVLKLRSLGKRIRDTTTGLGHIIWSDDGEELRYKGFEITMTGLKRFVSQQVTIAQNQLHEILLINQEEDREAVVPVLNIRMLKDDPTIDQPGWSFLQDPRNTDLLGHERWLLNRVAKLDWLQEEFLVQPKSTKWKRKAVVHYLAQVDAFLQRLLLLIHITGGQPARGSELLSIKYCNDVHGLRRNIFIENGLVSFVTFYHKGYSIDGSTKIIHRYLPKEVSELVIYYLWLVLPFTDQLGLLALDKAVTGTHSPFLWTTQNAGRIDGHYTPWPSHRLHAILKQEFRCHLNTEANIPIWRHSVIAVSRRHLRQAKFKKDFDIAAGPQATWNDAQACHTADLAGSIYARGIEEAPGHVSSARAEYRQISREWHSWLGFALYLSSRATALEPLTSTTINQRHGVGSDLLHKRKALEELSSNRVRRQRTDSLICH